MRLFPAKLDHTSKQRIARDMRQAPTPAEMRIWDLVRGRKLLGLKFRRQHEVGGLILDFYCPSLRLALELDGDVHSDNDSKRYDAARDELLSQSGISVLRVRNADATEATLHTLLQPLAASLPASKRRRRSSQEF